MQAVQSFQAADYFFPSELMKLRSIISFAEISRFFFIGEPRLAPPVKLG